MPRVSARWRSRVLLVQVRNRPAGAMLKVVALRHGRREFSLRRVAQRTRAASSVRMRLPRPPDRVQVQFLDSTGNSSSLIELRRRRKGSYGP